MPSLSHKQSGQGQPPGRYHRAYRIGAIVALFLIPAVLLATFNRRDDSSLPLVSPATQQSEEAANPLYDKKLYVPTDSNAARQAAQWRASRPEQARQMDRLASIPSSRWFANAISFDEVHDYVQTANDQSAIPVTVAYFLPFRDCQGYSTGGAPSEAAYYDYIDTYAKAIGGNQAVVILEPDALVHLRSRSASNKPCLTREQQDLYYTLISYAVERFKSLPATLVYIDAGNSGWLQDTDDMAQRLTKAGIDRADGFALNVSNFQTTEATVAYGTQLSDKTDTARYVIDTSRNGAGPYRNDARPEYNWCNPPGRALGQYPTVRTGIERVDAMLYIKNAGESDGTDPDPNKCFGGPPAGQWWPEYALGLIERWPQELQPKVSDQRQNAQPQ